MTQLPDPMPGEEWYTDNLADHIGHSLVYWETVTNWYDTRIDKNTGERVDTDGDFTMWMTKHLDRDRGETGVSCETCQLDLNVPNDAIESDL